MGSSRKSRKAYNLACISLLLHVITILYLILKANV
jgi:hypothetical protein